MILNSKYVLCFIVGMLGIYHVQAQTPVPVEKQTDSLEEVLITATRTQRQLSSLPLPAQIISKETIAQSGSVRLSDILAEQTGLITVPDYGGGEGIQIQGLDSQYILILIDGVPLVGRSAGTLDLSRITVGNIKQIEVVKGASSSLYGSDALGGVINIITESPQKPFQSAINYRGGSLNSHDLSLNTGVKEERLALSLFANRYSSDGYDLDESTSLQTVEPFTNYTAQVKGKYDFSEATSLLLSSRFYTQNQEYRASEILSGESDITEWNGQVLFSQQFTDKITSTLELYGTNYHTESYLQDEEGAENSRSFYDQTLLRPELRTVYALNDKHNFIGGIGYTYESLERTDFSQDPVFKAPYVYVQYDTHLLNNLNIIAGARYDMHNVYRSQLSPKLAARYKVDNSLAFKASVGSGFKAPAFRQLYFDFTNATVGYTVLGYEAVPTAIAEMQARGELANIIVPVSEFDDSLKPETSVNINLGVDYKFSKLLTTSLNLFRNNLNNLIDTRIIATKTNGQSVFSYVNVNESFTQGLEFSYTYNPFKNIRFSGGYQLLFAKDKEAVEAFEAGTVYGRTSANASAFVLDKKDYFGLYNRSRHTANFKVFYNLPQYKADVNMRATYRSKYGLSDTNGNGYLDNYDTFVDGYAIVDFAVNKALYKNITLGAGIDNLLNFTDTQNVTNIPGRLYFAKLNLTL